jgi:hypothetical protein
MADLSKELSTAQQLFNKEEHEAIEERQCTRCALVGHGVALTTTTVSNETKAKMATTRGKGTIMPIWADQVEDLGEMRG